MFFPDPESFIWVFVASRIRILDIEALDPRSGFATLEALIPLYMYRTL
jgi:hypothetical protein